jgi:hypothetical protein
MAHSTLPSLTHPSFPQVLNAALNVEVLRIAAQVRPQLSICCYQSPETSWGACDGQPCHRLAVIHDVASDLDYCFEHYQRVNR